MTLQQSEEMETIIGWCTSNLSSMMLQGKNLDEMTRKCLASNEGVGIRPDGVKDYIRSCLSAGSLS